MSGRQAIIVVDLPHAHDDAEVSAELRAALAGWQVADVTIDPGPPVPFRGDPS